MTTEDRREEIKRIIWENLNTLTFDYEGVPFEHIGRRPRYAFIDQILNRAADAIMADPSGERRRSISGSPIDPAGFRTEY